VCRQRPRTTGVAPAQATSATATRSARGGQGPGRGPCRWYRKAPGPGRPGPVQHRTLPRRRRRGAEGPGRGAKWFRKAGTRGWRRPELARVLLPREGQGVKRTRRGPAAVPQGRRQENPRASSTSGLPPPDGVGNPADVKKGREVVRKGADRAKAGEPTHARWGTCLPRTARPCPQNLAEGRSVVSPGRRPGPRPGHWRPGLMLRGRRRRLSRTWRVPRWYRKRRTRR